MTKPSVLSTTPTGATRVHLRLAATSDLHMNLLAYDYLADTPSDAVGLSRVASLIAQARAEVPGTLLLDNGDFLQGTPLGDFAAWERQSEGRPHPMIAAMNVLGYDAAALGNHEFDYGLEVLDSAMADAGFPVLAANVVRRRGNGPLDDTPLARPWMLLHRQLPDDTGQLHDVRVGVIGLLPPQVIYWDKERLEGRVEARCMIEAARAHVPALRAAGADVVVMLAHCGPSDRPETPGMENALVPLAGIAGVDAVVGGHLHRLIPGPHYRGIDGLDAGAGRICGKPVVMPGIAGSHLGVIDLSLEAEGGTWRVVQAQAALRPIAHCGPDGAEPLVSDAPNVVATVAVDHAATLAYIRRPVGHSEIALQSFTSFAAPCPVIHAINAAQRWYLRRALGATDVPILSAAAPFRCGGPAGAETYTDIAPGPLSYKNLAALYPFPNTIRAIRVTGAELRDWLERAAGAFNRLERDLPEQGLLNPDFPAYDFDVIDGLEWEIDLSRPALWTHDGRPAAQGPGRVRDLCHLGQPVADDQAFIIATNSYRIGGSGLYAPLARAKVVLAEQTTNREVLIRHIAEEGMLRGPVEPCWRFVPLGGVQARLETGRGVLAHLDRLACSGVRAAEDLGVTGSGFQRLLLTL